MLEYWTERMDVIDFLTPSSHLGKHKVCTVQTSCDHSLQTLFFRTEQHFLRTTENAGLQPIANYRFECQGNERIIWSNIFGR
jgi:hypothetical protein